MKQVLVEIISAKKKELVVLAALLICNLLLFFAISYFFKGSLPALYSRHAELSRKIESLDKRDVTSIYRQALQDMEKVRQKIPRKRQFAQILADIISSASSSRLVTGDISYKFSGARDQKLIVYDISMKVSGSYSGLKVFLGKLQNRGDLLVVDNVTFSNTDIYEENVTMALALRLFLQEEV